MKKLKKITKSLARGADRTLCILNGVIGSSLEKSQISHLKLKMTLYDEEKTLTITKKSLAQVALSNTGKICILAHGCCASQKEWAFNGQSYGSLLQQDFGLLPFYLRYNSGLHISTNGKSLSDLLEKLVRCYPKKINEIVLVGHSMGGLVFRSACHYGQKEKKKWINLVTKIFYLGTPHLGTHLEKLGKLTTTILHLIPNPVTKMIVSLCDLRSDGVKDLRHGYVTHEDWQKKNANNLFYWHQNKIPLLKKADHYLICGTISKVANSTMGRLFGDGLVHPASGTGQGFFSSNAIPFLKEHCKIIPGISHNRLQRNQQVYEQIRTWCQINKEANKNTSHKNG